MKFKKLMALGMAAVMTMSLAACGSSDNNASSGNDAAADTAAKTDAAADTAAAETEADTNQDAAESSLTYAGITLGEDYTDLTTSIKWIHHKTDREEDGTIQ